MILVALKYFYKNIKVNPKELKNIKLNLIILLKLIILLIKSTKRVKYEK